MSEVVRHDGDQISGAAMIGVASSLRWSRPDLTADLAGHVADAARPVDRALWLAALGWPAHGIALARASTAREGGRPDQAADAAAEGLRLLGVGDGAVDGAVSPHLVDALTAQRLGALLEAGRRGEARALADSVAGRTGARATRQ